MATCWVRRPAAAFFGGLRYGEGVLYTKNAGDLKVVLAGADAWMEFRR